VRKKAIKHETCRQNLAIMILRKSLQIRKNKITKMEKNH
jgi:hypothetical protein